MSTACVHFSLGFGIFTVFIKHLDLLIKKKRHALSAGIYFMYFRWFLPQRSTTQRSLKTTHANLLILLFFGITNVPFCVRNSTRFSSLVDLYTCQAVQLHGQGLFKSSSNEEDIEVLSPSLCISF